MIGTECVCPTVQMQGNRWPHCGRRHGHWMNHWLTLNYRGDALRRFPLPWQISRAVISVFAVRRQVINARWKSHTINNLPFGHTDGAVCQLLDFPLSSCTQYIGVACVLITTETMAICLRLWRRLTTMMSLSSHDPAELVSSLLFFRCHLNFISFMRYTYTTKWQLATS